MRRVQWRLFQGGDHHVFDLVEQDRRRPTGAQLIVQTSKPVGDEPAPSPRHNARHDLQILRDFLVRPPAAHASTILDHNANACEVLARLTHRETVPAHHRQHPICLRPSLTLTVT